MPDTIALLSGGMDSTVLVAALVDQGRAVDAVSILYGQRHRCELYAATMVARHYNIRHDVIDIANVGSMLGGSALTDDIDVPDGHYAEDSMRATVVPNRNAILLAIAAGVAVARGAQVVATAVHAGDHFVYPDCRPAFIEAIDRAFRIGTEGFGAIGVEAPFSAMGKHDICRLGHTLHVPLELTWSCYKGADEHCGTCGTCVERMEAFELAGVADPTQYVVSA